LTTGETMVHVDELLEAVALDSLAHERAACEVGHEVVDTVSATGILRDQD
jgi:hypothetical protein